MSLLEGDSVLPSGVSTGLGRDTALLFAAKGSDLVITTRQLANILAIADEVRATGRRCLPLMADIVNTDDCARVVSTATKPASRFTSMAASTCAVRGRWHLRAFVIEWW